MPEVVERHRIGTVLIAITRFAASKVRELLSLCSGLKVEIKILPVSYMDFQGRGAATMLQDLSPEDLLPREQVSFAERPQPELWQRVAELKGAAYAEDVPRVIALLRALVPSYRPAPPDRPSDLRHRTPS